MRICAVSAEFAPFHGWGAGTYASLITKAYLDAGHEVHILTFDAEVVTKGPAARPGARFHAIDWAAPLTNLPGWLSHAQRHALGVYRTLRALHDAHPFDYIEFPDFGAEGFYVMKARRLLGEFSHAVLAVRLHMSIRDHRLFNEDPVLDRTTAVAIAMEDDMLRSADALIACSNAMQNLTSSRLGAACPPIRYIPNPFDMDLLKELGAQDRSPNDKPDAPDVLFFGRLEHRKGVHLLVHAACNLIDRGMPLRIRLIGGDTDTGPRGTSMLAHVQQIIGPRRLDHFDFEIGRAPRSRIGPAVRDAVLCCFPSLWENFPYACLEAMALGGVVIGSDAGGMADIIEHDRSGLLFTAADVHALESTIERTLRDSDLRTRIAAAAPARIASLCNPSVIVRQTEDFIRSLPRRRPPRVDAGTEEHITPQPSPGTVSLLIVSDGDPRPLASTLHSIRAQTHAPAEIILALEYGATSDSIESAIASANARLTRASRPGIAAARNAALHAARSDFYLPLVAGDELTPDALALTTRAIASLPDLAFITGLVGFGGTLESPHGLIAPLADDRDLLTVLNITGPAIALFRRAAVLALGGYDEDTAFEEWLLYAAIARSGLRGDTLPRLLARLGPRSAELRPRGTPRDFQLARARLNSRFPDLPLDPGRAIRFALGESTASNP